MFFNSIKTRLKKAYVHINQDVAKITFPNGESEFIYVGMFLDNFFGKKIDLLNLIQNYVSIYSYLSMQNGNVEKTYNYAFKKFDGILIEDEIIDFVAFVFMNMSPSKDFNKNLIEQLSFYKKTVKSYIETVRFISNNLDIYGTKDNEEVGKSNNPILVAGVKGINNYLKNLKHNSADEISFWRSGASYLSDNKTGVSYAIDEYTIVNSQNKEIINKLHFNIYGTENCNLYPINFSVKK